MGVRWTKLVEIGKVLQNESRASWISWGEGMLIGKAPPRVQGWNAISAPQKGLSSSVPAIQAHT